MGRKERRQAQRNKEKLRKQREKESLKLPLWRRLAKTLFSNLWALAVAALTLLGGYAIFRPHVSVEPQVALNPVDPYTTQFDIKNENSVFDIHNVDAVCWPRSMQSGNNFSVVSPVPLKNVHHEILLLEAGANSTVDCPPMIGGIGSYSGVVVNAELEIDVSYQQSWWPFSKGARYPFAARRDVQGAVHWVHITPHEEQSFAETFEKRN
jgi:hypothetical protein